VSRLVFNASRHTYSLDGEWVPGVTGVTSKALGKPALLRWAAKSAADWAATHVDELATMGEETWIQRATQASDEIRDRAVAAGKQLHSIAQRLVYGDPVETVDPDTDEPYSDDVVRMGEQVARFMDRWDVTPDTALVECPIFHEGLRYAGTFDLVATLRGGQRWCVDYKTGATGIWSETALQLTAYSRATHVVIGERDMKMPPIDRCAALWVRPDTWELVPVASGDREWSTFRHAMAVAAWAGLRRNDVVGAALPVPEAVA